MNDDSDIKGYYDHLKKDVSSKSSNPRKNSGTSLMVYFVIALLIFSGLLFSGILNQPVSYDDDYDYDQANADLWDNSSPNVQMTMYTNEGCSCCHQYVDILEDNTFTVEVIYPGNMEDIKDYQQVPNDQRSCHTVKYGQYFIEGHVPMEAIFKLNQDKPAIDGISLAGMPPGSPGMSGEKSQTFEIMSIKDGQIIGTFMSI